MPDKWEYPWFAAWDLAFHCVALAHVDPAFAKYQLVLLCREWFQHPNGALPAYEWDFGDVNPPVQAWAALEVFAIDGGRDLDFLEPHLRQAAHQLHLVGQPRGRRRHNLFEGGFLGLDNIGPIDRSHLPAGCLLEQSDATGWMGFFALSMAAIATVLHRSGRPAHRPRHQVPRALRAHPRRDRRARACGTRTMASSTTGCAAPDGTVQPIEVRSMVGVIPLLASVVVDEDARSQRPGARQALRRACSTDRDLDPSAARSARCAASPATDACCSASSTPTACCACSRPLFDEDEFLSPHGLRSLSA